MCRGQKPHVLQMHTLVSESISEEIGATVTCTPIGNEPITYEWFDGLNRTLNTTPAQNELKNLAPGDYFVTATDSIGDTAKVKIHIRHCPLPTIVGYEITHPYSQVSRDGKIIVHTVPQQLENVRYMWSNGAITNEPVLNNVYCGNYSVTLVSKDFEKPIPFIHAAQIAKVNVSAQR